jgi:hypothetical protein
MLAMVDQWGAAAPDPGIGRKTTSFPFELGLIFQFAVGRRGTCATALSASC